MSLILQPRYVNSNPLDPFTEKTIFDMLVDGRSTKHIVKHFAALAMENDGWLFARVLSHGRL